MEYAYHLLASNVAKGGFIMVVIFGVSLVAWYLGVEKFLFLRRFKVARKQFMESFEAIADGNAGYRTTGIEPFDVLLNELAVYCAESKNTCSTTLMFREFLIGTVPLLDRGFSTMSAWISVAPLLGLLGTVAGMIQTFKVITTFGLGNPNLTAEGISVALLTTQAGLTVAFPMVLFHNFLLNQARNMKSRLFMDGEDLVNRMKVRKTAA